MKTILIRYVFAVMFATIFTGCKSHKTINFGKIGGSFTIGKIEKLHSTILDQDRILNIYLPDGYDSSHAGKFTTIYLLDGSADEDFIHVSGIVQYNSLPWINRLPHTIVVGIANIDRKHDLTYPTEIKDYRKILPTAGGSARFMDFIEKELQPWVEARYHSDGTKVLIGQSLGGLFAAEVLLKKPELFNKYIIISPSFWWDDGSLFKLSPVILNADYKTPTDIYVAVGEEGPGLGKIPHVMQDDARHLADTIALTKSPNVKVHFDYLSEETHATITHTAVFNAMRYLFKPIDEKK